MSSRLIPLTIGTPGFYGLNTQDAGSVLPPGWATKASNCVYDDVGRLASRRGYKHTHATVTTGSPTISSCFQYVDATGGTLKIFAANNKIWKEASGTVTEITGTITTPTDDDWQFVNFNGKCIGFQNGHAPIELSTTGGSFADSGGTQYNGSMVCSAYGRLWTVYQNTLYYSDLLINDFAGGSSGNVDLAKVWPNGMDEAVAIADFNGFLIVFGKKSMIIYQNADDVTNLTLRDTIGGVGCPWRDSVQTVGDDLIWASKSGVQSLKRVIVEQEGGRLDDISKHVRDALLIDLDAEGQYSARSAYNERLGFYLLSLPTQGVSYYFDVRFPNQDGSWRVTKWDLAPTALHYGIDNEMYLSDTAGFLSTYTGYKDAVASNGSGGTAYTMDFEGVWNDFGDEVGNYLKVMKNVSVVGSGVVSGTVTFKWAVDYGSSFNTVLLQFNENTPTQYGVAQYAVDPYGVGGTFERVRRPLARSGQVILPGIVANIDGFEFSLQRIDILAKIGKLGL